MSKKYILLLVFMLALLVLTGCSKEMSVDTLDKYFNTSGNSSVTRNVSGGMSDTVEKSVKTLQTINNTLEQLDLVNVTTTANAWKISDLISDLIAWQNDIPKIPLKNADGANLPYGEKLWGSIYLVSHSERKVATAIQNAIGKDILYLVNNKTKGVGSSRGCLNFAPSGSSSSTAGTGIMSDVNIALTVYGLSVSKLRINLKDSSDNVTTYVELSPSMNGNSTNSIWEFTYDAEKLYTTSAECTFKGTEIDGGETSETIDVQPIADSYSNDLLNTWTEKRKDAWDEDEGKFTESEFETLEGFNDNNQRKLLEYGYANGEVYFYSTDNMYNTDDDTTLEKNNKTWTSKVTIGYIKCGNTKYWYELEIGIQDVCTGRDDQYHMDVQDYAQLYQDRNNVEPFDFYPSTTWTSTEQNKYKYKLTNYNITSTLIYNRLKDYKNFIAVALSAKKYANNTTKMPSYNYALTSENDIMYLGSDAKDPAKATVELFANLAKDKITRVEKVPIYIGTLKIGFLNLTVLNEEIANVGISSTSTLQGTTDTTAYQTCKIYYADLGNTYKSGENKNENVGSQLYLLFGLYDVAVIDEFMATHDGTTDWVYYPSYTNGEFMYNIFDGNIYGVNATNRSSKYGNYDNTGGVTLYGGKDVVICKEPTYANSKFNVKNKNAGLVIKNLDSSLFGDIGTNLQSKVTMFALKTYEEGLFLPKVYNNDIFMCLGRKVVFTDKLFDGTYEHSLYNSNNNPIDRSVIGPNTPLYCVRTATEQGEYYEGSAKSVTYLVSAKRISKTITDPNLVKNPPQTVKGLAILNAKGVEDKVFESGSQTKKVDVNKLTTSNIRAGRLRTDKTEEITNSRVLFAADEQGVGKEYPPIWVWCTLYDVSTEVADYFKTTDFMSWYTWLNANNYKNYLAKFDLDEITTVLLEAISSTYDIAFTEVEQQDTVVFDTSALERTENWLNENNEKRVNAVIDTILRILGIVFIGYGILLFVCAIIDTVAIGEGDGLLKKVSFNRMKTVTGMTRAQRKELSERSEKGTYTTRAVNIMGVFPVALILWTVAALLLIGSSYSLIDMLMDIADGITNIFRGGIGKVD